MQESFILRAENVMTTNMFHHSDQMLRQFANNDSDEALQERLTTIAAAMGDDAFANRVAREVVLRTQPHHAIPEVYSRYRPVVRDGIEFFLSRLGRHRLIQLVVSQLKLDPDAGTHERLLELAKQFPTLHKLGQLIARNPNIDAGVKQWLIHLENGTYGTPIDGIMERIGCQLELTDGRDRVHVKPAILSEASVGAVIPFRWNSPSSQKRIQGVFKILKPGIRDQLEEELVILEETAAFFEKHRSRYPFKEFRFLDVFQEVRQMLVKEIDLAAEQNYLVDAARFFGDMDRVQIPQLFPFSTDTMTAMAYLNGPKITDAPLTPEQRERCAAVLFEALVCRPLFSRQALSLFHGDPHAGNILAVNDRGHLRVGLLDWTLAGRLTRSDRVKTAQLIQAVLKKDPRSIRRSVKALVVGASWERPVHRQNFRKLVMGWMQSPEFARLTLIKKTFMLLEQLTFEGFVFPADLMLFRKAMFTLEGVIYDLWPSFDMDAAVTRFLTTLMTHEIPKRLGNLFFPLADRPENYPSLISNIELQSLMVHHYVDAVRSGTRSIAGCLWEWGRMFGMPVWPALAPIPVSDDMQTDRSGRRIP